MKRDEEKSSGELLEEVRVLRRLLEERSAEAGRDWHATASMVERLVPNRTLLNTIPDGISIQDADKRILYQNKAMRDILGDCVGVPCAGICCVSEDARRDCPIDAAFADGAVHTVERRITRGGVELVVEVTATTIRNPEGKFSGSVLVLRDITGRRAMESALRESEAKYRAIVDCSPFGVTLHVDGRLLFWNEAMRRMLGYEPGGDYTGRSVFDFVHPDDLEMMREIHRQRMAGGGPAAYEARLLASDGTPRVMRIGTATVPCGDGGRASLVTFVDVTERVEAERALRATELKFKTLTEQSPGAVLIFDLADGGVVFANEKAETMFGFTREELAEPRFDPFSVTDPESHRRMFQAMVAHREGREVEPMELVVQSPRVGRREVMIHARPVDLDGARTVVVVATDITERKAGERQLQESEEKFRSLAAKSPNMIFINLGGRVVYANRRCEEVMEYPLEQICSPDFEFIRLIAPEHRAKVWEYYQRHLQGLETSSCDYDLVTATGRVIPCILSTKIISYGGQTAILGIVTEIADLKAAEQALLAAKDEVERQNAELRRMDRVKDDLIRDVSHELKAPVAKFVMQMEMLKRALSEKAGEEPLKTVLAGIESSIMRQKNAINNILNLARLEDGKVRYSAAEFRLDQLVQEVLEEYGLALASRGVRVPTLLPPVTVRSDRDMLWHVLSNVVGNAVKFTSLTAEPVIGVTLAQEGGRATVTVTDNGVGLEAGEMGHVFDKFFKADAASQGSGVGLTIARRIVEGLGGRIDVNSDGTGRGCTITIVIPARGETAVF